MIPEPRRPYAPGSAGSAGDGYRACTCHACADDRHHAAETTTWRDMRAAAREGR